MVGCTDNDETVRVVSEAGFTDVQVTGYTPFMCGNDDTTSTGFQAKNPQGKVIKGTVCCGLILKGCTIRY